MLKKEKSVVKTSVVSRPLSIGSTVSDSLFLKMNIPYTILTISELCATFVSRPEGDLYAKMRVPGLYRSRPRRIHSLLGLNTRPRVHAPRLNNAVTVMTDDTVVRG